MTIKMLIATDENNVIGAENRLLWQCPPDLQFFKTMTSKSLCIVGKNTYFSLPDIMIANSEGIGRSIVVLSRTGFTSKWLTFGKVSHHTSFEEFYDLYRKYESSTPIVIMGGEQIYRKLFVYVDEVYHTLIHTKVDLEGLDDVKYFDVESRVIGWDTELVDTGYCNEQLTEYSIVKYSRS